MRKGPALTLLLALLLFDASCGSEKQASGTRTIAFIVPTLANPFFVDMTEAARAAVAATPGFAISVQAPAQFTDLERQVSLIETAIVSRVAAICLVASDSKGVIPVLRKAQDAGIPVVLVDNTVDSAEAARAGLRVLAHIGSDNLLGGELAGQYIVEHAKGSKKVAMLEGVLGSEVANARKAGFLKAMNRGIGPKVVASQTANYEREQGLTVFKTILQGAPDIAAVFAANDEMALGAIRAAREAKRSGILFVGFDATSEALAAVDSGSLAATVAQQPKEMGRVAIGVAMRLINGAAVPRDTLVAVRLVTAPRK
jgi:ribose transport system substrate-binding protein